MPVRSKYNPPLCLHRWLAVNADHRLPKARAEEDYGELESVDEYRMRFLFLSIFNDDDTTHQVFSCLTNSSGIAKRSVAMVPGVVSF